MEILSEQEYWAMCEESIETNGKRLLNHDGYDDIWQCQNQYYTKLVYEVDLRPGLSLTIVDGINYQDLKHWSHHGQHYPLISKFHISGNMRTITPNIKEISDDYIEQIGKNYLFYLPNIDEIHHFLAGEHELVIVISIDIDILKTFSQGFEFIPRQDSSKSRILSLIEYLRIFVY